MAVPPNLLVSQLLIGTIKVRMDDLSKNLSHNALFQDLKFHHWRSIHNTRGEIYIHKSL